MPNQSIETLPTLHKAGFIDLKQGTNKRGREYEEAIRLDYLNRLNERYEAWISTYSKGELLIIDVDNNNFHEDKEDLGGIITSIDGKLNNLFS